MSSLARDSGESGAPGEGGSLAEIANASKIRCARLGGLVNTAHCHSERRSVTGRVERYREAAKVRIQVPV